VITVPSASDADIARATQEIADALQETIAAAPDQWYSFKPIWPSTSEEAADLERRATLMQADVADPGPAPGFG
jgi:lauroyl/myristoyl acyltransferase